MIELLTDWRIDNQTAQHTQRSRRLPTIRLGHSRGSVIYQLPTTDNRGSLISCLTHIKRQRIADQLPERRQQRITHQLPSTQHQRITDQLPKGRQQKIANQLPITHSRGSSLNCSAHKEEGHLSTTQRTQQRITYVSFAPIHVRKSLMNCLTHATHQKIADQLPITERIGSPINGLAHTTKIDHQMPITER